MNVHTVLKLMLAGVLTLSCMQAQAITLYFDQKAGFDSSTFNESVPIVETFSTPLGLPGGVETNYPASTFGDLSWGFGGEVNESSLSIRTYSDAGQGDATGGTSPTSAAGNTTWDEDEWWTMTTLTHLNYVINGSGVPLWDLDIPSILDIYSAANHNAGSLVLQDISSTGIEFNETNNAGPCPSNETVSPPCEDFFVFDLSSFAPVVFDVGGTDYTLDFQVVAGAGTVVIDNGNGTATVYTPEISPGTSDLEVQVKFRENIVPEPLALTMLGIGLAGIGFSKRQRKIS